MCLLCMQRFRASWYTQAKRFEKQGVQLQNKLYCMYSITFIIRDNPVKDTNTLLQMLWLGMPETTDLFCKWFFILKFYLLFNCEYGNRLPFWKAVCEYHSCTIWWYVINKPLRVSWPYKFIFYSVSFVSRSRQSENSGKEYLPLWN